MKDGNIVIVTKSGEKYRAVRPNRVAVEYDTPWLNTGDRDRSQRREGSRDWNIDPEEVLAKYKEGNTYSYNATFVISVWGNGYRDPKGVVARVPLNIVSHFEELPLEALPPCKVGCRDEKGHVNECWVPAQGYADAVGLQHDDMVLVLKKLVREAKPHELLHAWCVLFGEFKVLTAMREYRRGEGESVPAGLSN